MKDTDLTLGDADDSENMVHVKTPLEQTVQWIVEGQTDGDILATISEQWPGIEPQSLYDMALDKVEQASQTERPLLLGWCLMARREIYRQMLASGDLSGALRATERIESLAEKLG